MGLRETKIARTRERIVDAALDLFEADGYDQTTMEDIARVAEVGTSTLYRYFPTKDRLLVSDLLDDDRLAQTLRAQDARLPLAEALGSAIVNSFEATSDVETRVLRVRSMLDQTPGPRARLWDDVAELRRSLEEAVADRIGAEPDDLHVILTARLAFLVVEYVADRWRASDHRQSMARIARDVIAELDSDRITPPSLPPA